MSASSNGRSAQQARDFCQLKQRAAEYYRSNSVPQRMQDVLNTMFYDKPDDVYGHLANYFANFAKPAAISRIIGKEILDAEGQRTVEVELLCIIKNLEKSICFTTMSNCCHDPNYITQDTMDEENELKNLSVQIALEWINEPLNSLLKGLLPTNQTQVDKLLSGGSAASLQATGCTMAKVDRKCNVLHPVVLITVGKVYVQYSGQASSAERRGEEGKRKRRGREKGRERKGHGGKWEKVEARDEDKQGDEKKKGRLAPCPGK
ncbi:enolase 4-like [Mustelus asterias]